MYLVQYVELAATGHPRLSAELSGQGGSVAKDGLLVEQRVELPQNFDRTVYNKAKRTDNWES
jgi:hypothetical protein